jgi:hypothetical protein
LSYRLTHESWKLVFQKSATASHAWRESVPDYLRQQFGVGYGRLDVIARHPRRWAGDDVSGADMIAHAAVTTLCGAGLGLAAIVHIAGGSPVWWLLGAAAALAALIAERTVAAFRTWRGSRDRAALIFPALHLLRNGAWSCAIVVWCWRRLLRRPRAPAHTMRRTQAATAAATIDRSLLRDVIAVVPAYNEAQSLPVVIGELRESWPEIHLLIVDDGSHDGTFDAAARLGCETLRLPVRLGVGGAMRAGIRYARSLGYRAIVRLDGDGQHRAADLPNLLAPVLAGRADAVVGVRTRHAGEPHSRWIARAALGALLSFWLGRRVSDPTSGFWAFGPAAMKVLADHHPTGYPEPELLLVLRGHKLRTQEAPVSSRPRVAGITSLTTPRAGLAVARALLALVIVPLRDWEDGSG